MHRVAGQRGTMWRFVCNLWGRCVDNFNEVQASVRDMRAAATFADLAEVLAAATRSLQFDYFGLSQRASGQSGAAAPSERLVLANFPADWINQRRIVGRIADDPVLLASERSITPFVWSQLDRVVPLTGRHRSMIALARAAGVGDGYSVPIHVPGQISGLVSFVIAEGRAWPGDALPAAHYLACFAFEAARRLAMTDHAPAAAVNLTPSLTQRQLDCVALAARGKSDWVAGQLLGLSNGTVHKYLEAAKQRYGVSSRTELVVRALHDGHLSFADVLGNAAGDRRRAG